MSSRILEAILKRSVRAVMAVPAAGLGKPGRVPRPDLEAGVGFR
jgi:hypothetical protein